MKKHFLTPLTALLLLAGGLLVCGCEKEPPPPPPVVDSELVPTLELSVTPEGVIPYGEGSVVINFQTKDANQVLVNGVRKPSVKLGTHTIKERLFKDTTLNVKAINIKKMVEKSVTIKVGDWTTSTFGLVSKYPWRYDSLRISSLDGKVLSQWEPDPELLSWVDYYHKDGTITYSNHPGLKIPWSLPDDNSITSNGTTMKLQVNQVQMIISYQTTRLGEQVWFDMIYEHASDTPTDPI